MIPNIHQISNVGITFSVYWDDILIWFTDLQFVGSFKLGDIIVSKISKIPIWNFSKGN